MTTLLGDLRKATIDYLRNKLTITISEAQRTDPEQQPDQFGFTVTVTNTSEADGGIGLTHVRYQVQLNPGSFPPFPFLPGLIVPSGGPSFGARGEALEIGISTEFFDFQPSDENLAYLQMGESQSISFLGIARRNDSATLSLFVGIQADPDLNSIFPRNFTSARVERFAGFPL